MDADWHLRIWNFEWKLGLQFLSPAQGVSENFFVREFQHASAGDSAGKPSQLNWKLVELIRNKECSSIPFHVWVGGHDGFRKIAVPNPFDQRVDRQLIWPDPF